MNKSYFGLPSPDEIQIFDNLSVSVVRHESVKKPVIKNKLENKKEIIEKSQNEDGSINLTEYKQNITDFLEIKHPIDDIYYKINLTEIKPLYEYEDEEGNLKLNKHSLRDVAIEVFKPLYVNETLYIYSKGVYKEVKIKYLKSILRQMVSQTLNTSYHIDETIRLIIEDLRVNYDLNAYSNILNKHSLFLLNCKNGMVELSENGAILKKHSPDYYSTIQINAKYDEEAECPVFKKFLDRVVPDKNTQKVLQEIVGYSLTRMTYNKKMIFILTGEGDSGKSTFLNNTIEALLPETAKAAVPLQDLQKRFDMALLHNKVANIYADLETEALKDIGKIKTATGGGDKSKLERKGKDAFFDTLYAKMIFSCNTLPRNYSADKSDAFYNRIMIIPFNQVIPEHEKDPLLDEKLKKEIDGIFKWAIEGLIRFIAAGFKFSHSHEIEDKVNEYKKDNNPLLQFIDQYCTITNDEKDYIIRTKFQERYEKWCKEELNVEAVGPRTVKDFLNLKFNVEIKKKDDKTQKIGNGYARKDAYVGIKFKDELLLSDNAEDIWIKISEQYS